MSDSLVHTTARQGFRHAEKQIQIPQPSNTCRGISARLCLIFLDGAVNQGGSINLTKNATAQVITISVIHGAITAADVTIRSHLTESHPTGMQQELSGQGTVLTGDERGIKPQVQTVKVLQTHQVPAHILHQREFFQELHATHGRCCAHIFPGL